MSGSPKHRPSAHQRGIRGILLAVAFVLSVGAVWLVTDSQLFARWPSVLGLGTAAIAAPGAALPSPQRSLMGGRQWLNTGPLRAEDLRGKVVLVNFWTFGCVNCVNALPHVVDLYAKYRDRGLVVIGIHTPEFPFEHKSYGVRGANLHSDCFERKQLPSNAATRSRILLSMGAHTTLLSPNLISSLDVPG